MKKVEVIQRGRKESLKGFLLEAVEEPQLSGFKYFKLYNSERLYINDIDIVQMKIIEDYDARS